MKTVIVAASIVMLAAGAAAAKAPAPKEPAITFTVPAPCADVWQKVYTDVDKSWTVTVLPVSKDDETLPAPEVLDAFVARVPGLETDIATLDALDQDLFFVRLQTKSLAELRKIYPKLRADLLEAAKTDRCKQAAGQ